jgi:hypothetical protein
MEGLIEIFEELEDVQLGWDLREEGILWNWDGIRNLIEKLEIQVRCWPQTSIDFLLQ